MSFLFATRVRKRLARRWIATAAVCLATIIAWSAAAVGQAAIVSLTESVALADIDDPFVVGDKIFTDFDFIGLGGGSASAPSSRDVFITGVVDDVTGDFGLRFNLNGWNVGPAQSVNGTFTFKVSVAPNSNMLIHDVGLILTNASAVGTGVVGGSEFVYDANTIDPAHLVAQLSVAKTSTLEQLADHEIFDPVPMIWVRKDITVTGHREGSAHLSEFFQFYSQVPIPEPAALTGLLIGTALLGLRFVRRRRLRD